MNETDEAIDTRLYPRELSPREREVLLWLASHDFPGHDELIPQIESAKVKRRFRGDPTIELAIDLSLARPAVRINNVQPIVAMKETPGEIVGVSIVVNDGLIRYLEVVPYTGIIVEECPPIADLRIVFISESKPQCSDG